MAEYIKYEFSQGILDGTLKKEGYTVREGIIFKNNRVFLIFNSKVKEKMLYSLHNILLA